MYKENLIKLIPFFHQSAIICPYDIKSELEERNKMFLDVYDFENQLIHDPLEL